jgi:ParB-like chromosome segregation protein Spo0J
MYTMLAKLKKNAAAAAQLEELGQVPVSMVPLARLRPAPENDTLYKPLSPDDPEVAEMAESIQREGLIEPLLSTADYYLVSGHKRYWGCKRLGRKMVPCRVAPGLYHDDPRFLRLLREANRQRVKTVAEVAREEVVSADLEEAHRLLVAHRKKVSAIDIDIETIDLKDARKRCKISKAKEPFLEACLAVLRDRRDY